MLNSRAHREATAPGILCALGWRSVPVTFATAAFMGGVNAFRIDVEVGDRLESVKIALNSQ